VENATEPTAEILWESIADRLREALTETTYETWFGHAGPVSLGEHQLVVEVPNDFTRDWIQGHFLDFVSGVAREALGREVLVTFTVGERRPQPPPAPRPAETELRRREAEIPFRDSPEVDLNSKYTFDLFVIGSSNRFAHAAALAVASCSAAELSTQTPAPPYRVGWADAASVTAAATIALLGARTTPPRPMVMVGARIVSRSPNESGTWVACPPPVTRMLSAESTRKPGVWLWGCAA
jgi:hypothetical protein